MLIIWNIFSFYFQSCKECRFVRCVCFFQKVKAITVRIFFLSSSGFGMEGSSGYDESEYTADFHSTMSSLDAKRIEDDTYCSPNSTYVWCLPRDYNREKHPFTCKNQKVKQFLFKASKTVNTQSTKMPIH